MPVSPSKVHPPVMAAPIISLAEQTTLLKRQLTQYEREVSMRSLGRSSLRDVPPSMSLIMREHMFALHDRLGFAEDIGRLVASLAPRGADGACVRNRAIGDVFEVVRRIGSESVYGDVSLVRCKPIGASHNSAAVMYCAMKKMPVVDLRLHDTAEAREIQTCLVLERLVRGNVSPHFPLIYGSGTCTSCEYENRELAAASRNCHVLFVELANGDLKSWLTVKRPSAATASWMAQTVMALLALQVRVGLRHNDLHWGNLLWRQAPTGGWWIHDVRWRDGSRSRVYIKSGGQLWVLWDFGKTMRASAMGQAKSRTRRRAEIGDSTDDPRKNSDLSRIMSADAWQAGEHKVGFVRDKFGPLMAALRDVGKALDLGPELSLRRALQMIAERSPGVVLVDPHKPPRGQVLGAYALDLMGAP